MTIDEKLVDMEIRLARQDDLLDVLNRTVYRQQKKLDEIEALCAALARHVKEAVDAASERNPGNERPPHY